jgi:hypothetical protein
MRNTASATTTATVTIQDHDLDSNNSRSDNNRTDVNISDAGKACDRESPGISSVASLKFEPVTVNIVAIYHEYITHKSISYDKSVNRMNERGCLIRIFYVQYLVVCELFMVILSIGLSVIITLVHIKHHDESCDDVVHLIIALIVVSMDFFALMCIEALIIVTCCTMRIVTCLLKAIKILSIGSYSAFVITLCVNYEDRRHCASQGLLQLVMALLLPCSVILMTFYNAYYLHDFVICNNLDMMQIGCTFIYRTGQFFANGLSRYSEAAMAFENNSHSTELTPKRPSTVTLTTVPVPRDQGTDIENPISNTGEPTITVGICGRQLSLIPEV